MNILGYNAFYDTKDRLANKAGIVYEHRVVAERKLQRKLKDGETIHHINGCRDDNSEENIMVFSTNADHARFHRCGIAIKQVDGSYTAPKRNVETHPCLQCGKICSRIFCSTACFNSAKFEIKRGTKKPTTTELSLLIESGSWESIGRRYGVSGAAVKKWAKKYGIPIPIRNQKNKDRILLKALSSTS